MGVHKRFFEATGEAKALAEAHFDVVDQAKRACIDVAKELGAVAFITQGEAGGIRSLVFKDKLPTGWTEIRRHMDRIEARPRAGTKAFGEFAEKIRRADLIGPDSSDLARVLGYDVSSFPTDGRSLYFPTATRLRHPNVRFVMCFPFTDGTNWAPRADLTELRESQYVAAFEAHNDVATRLQREADAAKGAAA